MKQKNLLEYEIRRKLVASLLAKAELEKKIVKSQMENIYETHYEDGSPVPREELEKELKQLIGEQLELEKTIILFRAEVKRLNSDNRRKILKTYSPAMKEEAQHQLVKSQVDDWKKRNPGRSNEEAYHEVAQLLSKKRDNVQRLYNYIPKKLQK